MVVPVLVSILTCVLLPGIEYTLISVPFLSFALKKPITLLPPTASSSSYRPFYPSFFKFICYWIAYINHSARVFKFYFAAVNHNTRWFYPFNSFRQSCNKQLLPASLLRFTPIVLTDTVPPGLMPSKQKLNVSFSAQLNVG